VIILVAVALITVAAYRQVTEDLVIERNQEVARLSASQLATELSDYTALLTAVAQNESIYWHGPSIQRVTLGGFQSRLAIFDGGVLILDKSGR
jgi:hypothetical protein